MLTCHQQMEEECGRTDNISARMLLYCGKQHESTPEIIASLALLNEFNIWSKC